MKLRDAIKNVLLEANAAEAEDVVYEDELDEAKRVFNVNPDNTTDPEEMGKAARGYKLDAKFKGPNNTRMKVTGSRQKIKNLQRDLKSEEVEVGGGATGSSKVPDPTTKQADVAPGRKKAPGMPAEKLTTDGVTSVEDTDDENNTAPTGDMSAKNKASVAMKSEHVEAMFDGEELSEQFKEKVSTIFEAAVNFKLNELAEELQAEYESKLTEEVERLEEQQIVELEELTNKIDQYLNYVVEQWIKENEVAVEASLRSEVTEDFIAGLKNLFSEHYIDIPDDKVNVVEELATRVEELEAKLNESINENIDLKKSINEMASEEIFAEISEGLTVSQSEKLKKLAEGVIFEDVDGFKKKLQIVKENYFPSNDGKKTSHLLEESFDGEEPEVVTSQAMSKYVRAISRTTIR